MHRRMPLDVERSAQRAVRPTSSCRQRGERRLHPTARRRVIAGADDRAGDAGRCARELAEARPRLKAERSGVEGGVWHRPARQGRLRRLDGGRPREKVSKTALEVRRGVHEARAHGVKVPLRLALRENEPFTGARLVAPRPSVPPMRVAVQKMSPGAPSRSAHCGSKPARPEKSGMLRSYPRFARFAYWVVIAMLTMVPAPCWKLIAVNRS